MKKDLHLKNIITSKRNQGRDNMKRKGVPKRNGSGQGTRANRGRGGCSSTQRKGKGRNRK